MKFKKYHRKYPDTEWDYKAISTFVDGREIIYYVLKSHGEDSSGIEIYGGRNYVVGSSDRAYSRTYLLDKVPPKYKKVVLLLMKKHSKTKWSNKSYVNVN